MFFTNIFTEISKNKIKFQENIKSSTKMKKNTNFYVKFQ